MPVGEIVSSIGGIRFSVVSVFKIEWKEVELVFVKRSIFGVHSGRGGKGRSSWAVYQEVPNQGEVTA
jgi:hypothetical protein